MSKLLKSRAASIALIAVPAIVDLGLLALYRTDIAESWLSFYWPRPGREIDRPASIFWICLIWLGLFLLLKIGGSLRKIWKANRLGERFIRLCAKNPPAWASISSTLLVATFTTWLFLKCVWTPWKNRVVIEFHLLLLSLIPTLMIFLCSSSEIAISSTSNEDIQSWILRRAKISKTDWRNYLEFVKKQEGVLNTAVILANVIFVILLTELVIWSTNQQDTTRISFWVPYFHSVNPTSVDAFTTVGTTIILFGAAELTPKQIAIAMKERALILLSWWIVALYIVLAIFSYGLVGPIHYLGKISSSKGDVANP